MTVSVCNPFNPAVRHRQGVINMNDQYEQFYKETLAEILRNISARENG